MEEIFALLTHPLMLIIFICATAFIFLKAPFEITFEDGEDIEI